MKIRNTAISFLFLIPVIGFSSAVFPSEPTRKSTSSQSSPAPYESKNSKTDTPYIRDLKKRYSSRLKYKSEYAKKRVQDFYIACNTSDGRLLPLENVILAKLESGDRENAWLVAYADSRGSTVRIYDNLVDKSGKTIHSSLAFVIDEWDELRVISARVDAIMNTCYGTYGPIWIVP